MFDGMKEMKALIENAPKGEDGQLTSEFKHDFAQAMNMLSDVEGENDTNNGAKYDS